MKLKLDCRHFRGDKPCRFACSCEGCSHYAPMGKRILVVKLDAIGDVARTTTILRPLHAKYDPCHITWLVHPLAEEMLRGNPLIDAVLPYQPESLEPLRVQRFDLVLSLDKTPRATAVAMWSNAPEKLGFGLSEFGTVFPLNPEAEYAFQLGLDDELKFKRNRKTYQEVLFEAIRLPYAKEEYEIEIDERDRLHADALFKQWKVAPLDVVVGLNLGGGSAFANKMWNALCATAFLDALLKELPCKVLLFGAERERATIEQVLAARPPARRSGEDPNVLSTGTGNTIRQFQALLARCAVVVTGDSLGMHLAIAEKRPVVALFGPTCAQEIELYGRGEVITAASHCAPCYRPECARNPSCMQVIGPGPVVAAVKRWLNGKGGAR